MYFLAFFIKTYSLLRNYPWLPVRVMSPFRYVFRRIANYVIPIYLSYTSGNVKNMKKKTELLKGAMGKKIIVSLTTFPARIDKVWIVIECMLRQTVCPDKIVLYLSKEQFSEKSKLPKSLLAYEGKGLNIELMDGDLRSHKKYRYAFFEYVNDIVITIDDDIYYPLDMIEQLLCHVKDKKNVVVFRYGNIVTYDEKGKILPYSLWKTVADSENPNLFFGSGGGTLFFPSSLYNDVCNEELFLELTPSADDIWLNVMTRLGDCKLIKLKSEQILPILYKENEKLSSINNGNSQNDVQIENIRRYYLETINRDPFEYKY